MPGIHAATKGGAGMAAADQAALAGAKAAKEAKRYGFSKEAPDVRMVKMRWKYGREWWFWMECWRGCEIDCLKEGCTC